MYIFLKNTAKILLSITVTFSCSNSICMHNERMKETYPRINTGKKRARSVSSDKEQPAAKKARANGPTSDSDYKKDLDRRIASICVKIDNSICDHTDEDTNPLLCAMCQELKKIFKIDQNFDIQKEYNKATEQWTDPERLDPIIERNEILKSIATNKYSNTPPSLEYLPDQPYHTIPKIRRRKVFTLLPLLVQIPSAETDPFKSPITDRIPPTPLALLSSLPSQPAQRRHSNTPDQKSLPKPDFSCFSPTPLTSPFSLSSSD